MKFSSLLVAAILLSVPVESSFAGPMMGGPVSIHQRPSYGFSNMAVSGDNVYMVWVVSSDDGKNIFFGRSTDGGRTFGDPVLIGDSPSGEPHVVAEKDTVYVAWATQVNSTSKLVVKYSTDGGTAFHDAIPDAGSDVTGINILSLIANPSGLQMIWSGLEGPNRTQVLKMSKSPDGMHFDKPMYLSDPHKGAALPNVVTSGTYTYVLWDWPEQTPCMPMYKVCNIVYYIRPIVDGTVGATVRLDHLTGQIPVHLSADKGTVYVEGLERSYSDNNIFQKSTVTILKSTDGAMTFSSSTVISDVNMAGISLVPYGGNVYQFWTVYDNGFAPEKIYAEKSTDGAVTFGSPVEISENTTPLAVNLDSDVIISDGSMFAAWSGLDSSGASHIFFKKLDPDMSGKVREIDGLSQARVFQIIAQGADAYLLYATNYNLFFDRVTDAGSIPVDLACPTDTSYDAGNLAMTTPQIEAGENPSTTPLAGWLLQIKSNISNPEKQDIKASYRVDAELDGKTVWSSQDNMTALCGSSSDASVNWSPTTPGNYTINVSLVNQEKKVLSSNSTTVKVLQNSDLDNFTSKSPVRFEIMNKTTQVDQEGHAQFLVSAGPSSPNYKLGSIWLSIDSPKGLKSWFDKYSIFSPDNKPDNLTMYVYAGSAAKPGPNTLDVLAKGSYYNMVTGEYDDIGNPMPIAGPESTYPQTILDTQKGYANLTTIGISVSPKIPSPSTYVVVGKPILHPEQFCSTPSGSGGGTSCMGFIGYEEFPLQIFASSPQKVRLSLENFTKGSWVKFVPQDVVATPDGVTSEMISNDMEPFMINVLSTQVPRLYANSSGTSSFAYIPMIPGHSLKIVNSTSPIEFGTMTTNINNTTPNSIGLVYDNGEKNSNLPVSLSVLGVQNGNNTDPMPSWLSIDFVPSTFTLNSSQPYYFEVETSTTAPPSGANATVVVGEKIGGRSFTGHIQISVPHPVYMGMALASSAGGGAMTPIEETKHMPPLKLFESGTKLHDITCQSGLDLVEKKETKTPACVKSATKARLIQTGWAMQSVK